MQTIYMVRQWISIFPMVNLKADFEYPDKLHNDYSLAPEKRKISDNMLSNYCSKIAKKYGIKFVGDNNLLPNLQETCKFTGDHPC